MSGTQFTPEFIKAQRELADKATERPWWVGHSNTTSLEYAKTYSGKMLDYNPQNTDLWMVGSRDPEGVPLITSLTGNGPTSETNADFVMSAANHYPAALTEIERLRDLLAGTEKDREELREMATELKRMHAAYLYADSVGCAVEWHNDNGEDYRKLEAALMDKLTGRNR
jgi:hypothetical protein